MSAGGAVEAMGKVSAAKLWLISQPPPGATRSGAPRDLTYLAHALYALIPVPSSQVPRAQVDEGWRLYVNTEWATEADVPTIGAEIVHLTWHLLLEHATRARTMGVDRSSADEWTLAADISLDPTLALDDLRPATMPVTPPGRTSRGLSAEEYFAALSGLPVDDGSIVRPGPDRRAHDCGSGADGQRRGYEDLMSPDAPAVEDFEAMVIRERVAIDFRDHHLHRGTDPGEWQRWVEQVLDSVVAWEPLLRRSVRKAVSWVAGQGDYTYSRPSRRAGSLAGVILPGQQRPVPRVSLLVDTSGSVDDELLAQALGELDAVISGLGIPGGAVRVYSVDAAVHTVQQVRRSEDLNLIGAGGTDLRIGFSAIEEERPRPDVIVVLTDGGTPWPPAPPPASVVVVALLGRDRQTLPPTPEWATRVECVID